MPSDQWRVWHKMKRNELQEELKGLNLSTHGSKAQMLKRLGVPKGYGESAAQRSRQEREKKAERKRLAEAEASWLSLPQNKKVKAPEDDPTHVHYTERCCNAPRFPRRFDPDQPAGHIIFPDGSLMEVYRCLNCGQVPRMPNAPPIRMHSESDHRTHEEDFDLSFLPFILGLTNFLR